MRTVKQLKGDWGEEVAENYLRRLGYTSLARNFRIGRAEIDRIMDDGGVCVFVEVKTRSNDEYGDPEEEFAFGKCERLLQAAEEFLECHERVDEVRIDLVTVTGSKYKFRVKHWPDVISFPFGLVHSV